MNEIEISNKAFVLAHRLQTIAPQMSSLVDLSKQVSNACREYSNGDIVPAGYNIDPILGTPFYVVYQPNDDNEIHSVWCRGAEVTDYIDDYTRTLAEAVAFEAWTCKQNEAEDYKADLQINSGD
jgi:hypothetical protein